MSSIGYRDRFGVSPQQSHLQTESGASIRRTKSAQMYSTHKKPKPYKITYEQVSEVKQSLRTQTTSKYHMRGYTFVPSGNPKLTKWCQDYCSKHGILVHPVNLSNKEHQDPHHITSHTHRIGIHFPDNVVQRACAVLKIDRIPTRLERMDSGDETYDEIAAAIKEHFPRIPDGNIDQVIRQAWPTLAQPQVKQSDGESANGNLLTQVQENARDGSGNRQDFRLRVGDARDLTLGRKAQLAVAAHIRHEYTNYDQLLATGDYNRKEARNAIQPRYVQKVTEWRGEDGKASVEEMFREIIEILDEDEDEREDGGQRTPEIIDCTADSGDDDEIMYIGSTNGRRLAQYRAWRQGFIRPRARNSDRVLRFITDEHRHRARQLVSNGRSRVVQNGSGQAYQLVESPEGLTTLIPIYPVDAYHPDWPARYDQINGGHRSTEIVSQDVALNSRSLNYIESVPMTQQIASPDIAIPSVEGRSVYRSPEHHKIPIQAPQPIASSVRAVPQQIEVAASRMASDGFYEPFPVLVRTD